MIDYKELNVFTSNAETHVLSIIDTFNDTVKQHGPDSFVPMCMFLDSGGDVKLVLTARSWKDKDDMYKCFSEMLFAFSTLDAHCCLFVNDVRITTYEQEAPNSKKMEAQDAINIAFVSKESSALISFPYSIENNNNVILHHDLAITSPLSKEDPSEIYQGDMVELFYVMSHIESPSFSPAQLINFYNLKGFTYKISDEALVDKVKIEVNTDDKIN